ncbi:HWE histidine kinase domain-containing protein [Belnapia rosea]|uniref:histidine kinase n=1 Tax=Belnapia rosea TaxID=938405 RepID=A0A1G6P307_9PROT|nr:HWE histidine kinase domain-containing protein [Belnapia rosea]SDC74563.1 Bacteriophytochrome (light-regulated signal transduction histidine kinase) [Belnapia rosea]
MTSSDLADTPVDLSSCDREPIHRLGLVQPWGFLLSATNDGTIRHASANVTEHLSLSPEAVIGRRLDQVLERSALHDIRARLQGLHGNHQTDRLFSLNLIAGQPPYDVAVHFAPSQVPVFVIEAEPSAPEPRFDAVGTVKGMMSRLLRAKDLTGMHDRAARQVRAVLGFDRVMIYRFGADGTGEVVGESRSERLDSFRNLRFPATDIPKQARALYCRNWLRLIENAEAAPVPILPAPTPGEAPLDLSSSVLRHVSPVHIEYLRNMGVAASLSISIMRGDELWGLIACHHAEPLLPSFQRRSAAELFGQLYSLQIESLERMETAQHDADARAAHDRVLAAVSADEDLSRSLQRIAEEMRQLIPSDGIVIRAASHIEHFGSTPDEATLNGIITALNRDDASRVFATREIASLYPPAAAQAETAAGMLVIPISRASRDYLILFRREMLHQIAWAGNPEKVATPGATRLHPRRSFEAWQQLVRGQSAPWLDAERRMAEALRVTLLEVVVRLSATVADQRRSTNDRQELLIAELNHRVRNILALIRALVSRSRESAETLESFVTVLNGRIQSLARAHDQLTDDRWGPVGLRGMIESEFHAYLGDSQQHRINLAGPPVLVEPQALTVLALVMHELATNAAKYGALSDRYGVVDVRWELKPDNTLLLRWRERDGPPVVPPNRRGFGTTVIERSIPFELQGEADVHYSREGLEAEFIIPARFVQLGVETPQATTTLLKRTQALRVSGTAMVVEDSTLLAMDAEEILLELGFDKVEVVGTVSAALSVLRRLGNQLAFALLDVNLGEQTSLPAAEALHAAGIPFAFATGYGTGLELPPKLAEVASVVPKPYRRQDIADLVGRTLGCDEEEAAGSTP